MKSFNGKVAVITGAASGIGLAIAERLLAEGAHLVVSDIEKPALDAAVDRLSARGASVIGTQTDVGNPESVNALADLAFGHHGRVNMVFNNAGVTLLGPVHELTEEDWRWCLQVNLWGAIHGVRSFLPRMIASREEGHLSFTASFSGLYAFPNLTPYGVAKAGVVALAEALETELRETQIGVSVLCPMRVVTNIAQSNRNRPKELAATGSIAHVQRERPVEWGTQSSAGEVARQTLDGIRRGDVHIHTHKAAEKFFRERSERILSTFAHASS